jgi:CRP-like cAMP-binding protein
MTNRTTRNVYLDIVWKNHPDALEFIEGVGEALSFAPGECITAQDEEGTSMYLILEGTVSVRRSMRGSNRLLGRLDRHRSFGEVSLLTGARRMATVTADTPVRVLKIDRDNLDKLAVENPRLALSIYRILAESLALTLQTVGDELARKKKDS